MKVWSGSGTLPPLHVRSARRHARVSLISKRPCDGSRNHGPATHEGILPTPGSRHAMRQWGAIVDVAETRDRTPDAPLERCLTRGGGEIEVRIGHPYLRRRVGHGRGEG